MKFRKFGQLALATAASLAVGFGLTACTGGSIDFIYATASKNNPGQVVVFKVDGQSGTLTPIQTPVYPAGRNPVALITSSNGENLYVANHDDNTITQFAIGTDGKLYPQHNYNTPGTFPTSMALDSANKFLYVVDNYQPGFTDTVPGLGAVVVFPVNTDGSLGVPLVNTAVTPNISYFPVGLNPSAVAVLPTGTALYVINKGNNTAIPPDAALCLANPLSCATVSVFNVASGVLTPVATVATGVAPDAIAIDGTSSFVYVADSIQNLLYNYVVGPSGTLTPNAGGVTSTTGNLPDAVTIDPDGKFLYVANYTDNSISAYTLNSSGIATNFGTSFATGTGPTCLLIEPSLQHYVYTTNFLDSTVSALQLDPGTGDLTNVQNTPYPTPGGAGQPTCIAAIKHGNHTPLTE